MNWNYFVQKKNKRSLLNLSLPLLFYFLLIQPLMSPIPAAGATIELADKKPEEAKEIVGKCLGNLKSGYKEKEDTEGFHYHLANTFFNVYKYDIYITTYDQKNSIVRIDAPARMSYALGNVFEQYDKRGKFEKKYPQKSVLLGDITTVISPGLGYIYTNINSPFARDNIWFPPIIHFMGDAILFWFGSRTFFTHNFDPTGEGAIATAILMGSYRLYFLTKHHIQLVAQNRMVKLGYTFRY